MKKINLGDEVKHIHTGFKGIAISSHEYISGCRRITIQPKIKKDGTLLDDKTFDEPEIEVIKKNNIKLNNETGGWQPENCHYNKKI